MTTRACQMDRRGFLGSLVGGLAVTAAVREWPFRVFSFPTDIQIAQPEVEVIPAVLGEWHQYYQSTHINLALVDKATREQLAPSIARALNIRSSLYAQMILSEADRDIPGGKLVVARGGAFWGEDPRC
jgi:hypothetical protein